MTVTLASFRLRFPAFAETSDSLVSAKIEEARTSLDARVFGAQYDEAVGYKAAHALAIDPGGQNARMVSDTGETTYNTQFQTIARACAGGPWAIGQKL